jgi:hypothetical protein
MTASTTVAEGPVSFAIILHKLEDGQLLIDLTQKTHELTSKMAVTAEAVGMASGEIVLRLRLDLEKGGTVGIRSDIQVKEPKLERAKTVMWLSKGRNLVSENPRQQGMFPREVMAPVARDLPAARETETRGV